MSDYRNKRGKDLVALALTDFNAQRKLNYRSILEAQRDLFESNTEHVRLDDQRDAEVESQNKSERNIEEQSENVQKCNTENFQLGDINITSVSQSFDPEGLNDEDILTKNSVMEYDNDNVPNTEIGLMKSEVEAPIISECSDTENVCI